MNKVMGDQFPTYLYDHEKQCILMRSTHKQIVYERIQKIMLTNKKKR